MKHPEIGELALFVSRDLDWWRNRTVRRHLERCDACRQEVAGFRRAAHALETETAGLPPGVRWDRLAAEMRANIRLGLEAGECVGGGADLEAASSPSGWYSGWNLARFNPLEWSDAWRAAAAVTCLLTVSGGLWIWKGPAGAMLEQAATTAAVSRTGGEVVLRTTAGGIAVEREGRALTLTHDGTAVPAMNASIGGSLDARYIDEDSSEVTIHHVYAE